MSGVARGIFGEEATETEETKQVVRWVHATW
jgi:hypothetical protein